MSETDNLYIEADDDNLANANVSDDNDNDVSSFSDSSK